MQPKYLYLIAGLVLCFAYGCKQKQQNVNDLEYLSMIAKEIGNHDEAKMFAEQKAILSERINNLMWDSSSKFYYDKTLSGEFIKSKAISGLLPLFAGIPDKQREEILFTQVMDSTEWFTEIPFPSLSLKDQDYSLNMWRGGTWINYSYFIFRGLKRYNRIDAAQEVSRRIISKISGYYNTSGTIYEYYDPLAKTHPDLLPRKKVTGALHEFGWSAALYICFVNEQIQ